MRICLMLIPKSVEFGAPSRSPRSVQLHPVCDACLGPAPAASRIRYELTQGNVGGAFGVKNSTGAIFVAGPLDYETRSRVRWGRARRGNSRWGCDQ